MDYTWKKIVFAFATGASVAATIKNLNFLSFIVFLIMVGVSAYLAADIFGRKEK